MKGWLIVLAAAVGLGLLAEDAFADRPRHSSTSSHRPHVQPHHHHHHFSPPRVVVVPSYAPRRYYYAAPVYVSPPVVVAQPLLPSMNSGYWYFCPDSRAYYPYVLECPSGWLAVVPGAGGPPN